MIKGIQITQSAQHPAACGLFGPFLWPVFRQNRRYARLPASTVPEPATLSRTFALKTLP